MKLVLIKKRKPLSEEHKKKISESGKGRRHSEASKKKISESLKGRIFSEEHLENLSKSHKGKDPWNKGLSDIYSEATKKKMSKSRTGKKQKESSKKKISESLKGRIFSEEHKKKIGLTRIGKKHSEASKKKMSESGQGKRLGKKHSEATKKKISKSHKGKLSGVILSEATKKKISNALSTPKQKERARNTLRETRHKYKSPNGPESKIIEILKNSGIKHQFQVDVEYTDIEKGRVSKSLDFLLRPKRIIEHNGTYIHADPRKYKPDALIREHNKMIKASEIWNRERIMLRQIRKKGYKILVIWQLDLYNDTENTIKKILKFASKT